MDGRRSISSRRVLLVLLAGAQTMTLWSLHRSDGRLDALSVRLDEVAHDTAATDREATATAAELHTRSLAQPDAAVARRVQDSVYMIVTDSGSGSGFVIASGTGRSSLVTNSHVVAGAKTVRVQQGELTFTGRVTEEQVSEDLAVIDVDYELSALHRSDVVADVGDAVLAVGSPLGLGISVSAGIVSALRDDVLQFSAAVSPGSSGGPVVDSQGGVIGVIVAKAVAHGAEGVSFAIPIETACQSVNAC